MVLKFTKRFRNRPGCGNFMAVKDKGAEMDLYEKLVNKEEKLALVGLG